MSGDGSEVVRLDQRVPFTMVDNPIIRALDDYVALGLYVDMLSWPPGWRINLRELSRSHKQGRQVLTSAMNDLIERGLVFRVRYQQGGGLWMTRTYVCARAVTEAELLEVRTQYLGRCRIETSSALMPLVNPGQPRPDPSSAGPDAVEDAAATAAVESSSPSTRFPAPGEPDPGVPAVGQRTAGPPTRGRRDRQRPDSRPKTPPPNPPSDRSAEPRSRSWEEEVAAPKATAASSLPEEHVDARLADALIAAWPSLTDGALRRLAPDLAAGAAEIGTERLLEHLTTNTGGVMNPAAVLKTRLRDLPRARPRTALPSWCGQCSSPEYRWIEDDADGSPLRPCPRCSAQAAARRVGAGRNR